MVDMEIISTDNEKIFIPNMEDEIYNVEIRPLGRKANGEPRWWTVQRPIRDWLIPCQGAILPTDFLGWYEKKEDAVAAVTELRKCVFEMKFAIEGLRFFGKEKFDIVQFDMNIFTNFTERAK